MVYQYLFYSLTSVLIALHMLSSSASGERSLQWHSFKGFYFQFSLNATNWFSAREACHKLEGADLAIIDSVAKYQAVHKNKERMRGNVTVYWIGLRRNPTNVSNWLWVNGSSLQYAKWGDKEPNKPQSEHCAEWWPRNGGILKDHTCCTRHNYVCGKEAFLSVKDHSYVREVLSGQPLTCPVSGFPVPNVTWYEIRKEKEYVLDAIDGILHLNYTTRTGRKSYLCRANNGHENATVRFEIKEAPRKPSLETFLSQHNPTGEIGDEVMLVCSTSSTRNVNYTWLKDGDVIGQNREKRIHLKSDQDFGEYKCVATNEAGNATDQIVIEKKTSTNQVSEYIYWIIIGILSMLLFFTIIVLTTKVCKQKAFVPIQNDLGEEEIPMQTPGAMSQHTDGAVYADLLPRESKDQEDTENNESRPAYVNTSSRDLNMSRGDAGCMYESLTPPSPSYVNVRG